MNTRKTCLSIGLLAFFLVFGALAVSTIAVPQLEAAPISTNVSIRDRIQRQTDNCNNGGGTIEVVTSPRAGGPITSATTTCKGGLGDGTTCTNTLSTVNCSKPLIRPTPLPPHTLPDTADPNAADVPATTPMTTGLADPGLPQTLDPGLPDPTPTPGPKGPMPRPTFEPVADPLD